MPNIGHRVFFFYLFFIWKNKQIELDINWMGVSKYDSSNTVGLLEEKKDPLKFEKTEDCY
jgi:hypothetical protein